MTTYAALHATLAHKQIHGPPKLRLFLGQRPSVAPTIKDQTIARLDQTSIRPINVHPPLPIHLADAPSGLTGEELTALLDRTVTGVSFEGREIIVHLDRLPRLAEGVLLCLVGAAPPLSSRQIVTEHQWFTDAFRAKIEGVTDRTFEFCPNDRVYHYASLAAQTPLFEVRSGAIRFLP